MTTDGPFVWRRRVGMRDVDAWGVVWYGNYLAFCDEARAELLRHYGLAPGTFVGRGFTAPVVEVHSRYRMPARYDELVVVSTRVRPPRGARLCFDFTIRRVADQALLAEISTTLVLVRATGELVYFVPDDIAAAIGQMIADQPESEAAPASLP